MQKTLIFDLARMPYLRPMVHAMDFKRFSPSENAKNFDKYRSYISIVSNSRNYKTNAQIGYLPICAQQIYLDEVSIRSALYLR